MQHLKTLKVASAGNLRRLLWKPDHKHARELQLCARAEPSPRQGRGSFLRPGSLRLRGGFRPVGFARRTREAGPLGQDGVTTGSEARAAAGQRSRRPPRLSTSFVQVGGQRHAVGLWG